MNNLKSKFLKVKCSDCANESVLFNKVSSSVSCQFCGSSLASSTGGTANITAEIVEELD
tara:strand:+ start:497 stop:673 length:177 start_codon:yes stop_codon:yes gene_type:complete